jgi:hypothetical protein
MIKAFTAVLTKIEGTKIREANSTGSSPLCITEAERETNNNNNVAV